jgi:hypothetical protein
MPPAPHYHLRFQILPSPRAAQDARDLAAFCKAHKVEEVALFLAAEEWNNGLLSKADENRWFRAIRTAKTILDQAGIAVSLNPWMTALHCDRGRAFPKDRRFIPMVSPAGEASRACASFADPAFQTYLSRLYARFARLGFRVIWIEDDFRFHNHGPLTWGGGFEAPVLARFVSKLGKPATREDVVAALLKPGKPHAWRALWQSVWRELHLEVAGQLAAAVGQASGGKTTLGLMSSDPRSHSVEGRDWHALFKALSINGRVAHRPHYAGYSEGPGHLKTGSIQTLDLQKQFRIPGCEVAPEVENFPFTRWSKSDSLTWTEMALCQFNGSDALLLDIFPFSGNRASAEPEIGTLLDQSRPALAWIAARFPPGLQSQGVGVPYKMDSATHVRLPKGASSLHQYGLASPFEAGRYLLQNGVPITSRLSSVNAVFGALMWTFTDSEIEALLRHGLLLDGESASILEQRGFAGLTGVRVRGIPDREEAPYAIEEVTSRRTGVEPGFYMNANLIPRMARLVAAQGGETWTRILCPDGRPFGPGWVVFENRLGGRVATCAAPDPAQLAPCNARQKMAHHIVRWLAKGRFASPLADGGPYLLPMHFKGEHGEWMVVLNGMTDPAPIHLDWPGRKRLARWSLPPLGKPVAARPDSFIPYLGFCVASPLI